MLRKFASQTGKLDVAGAFSFPLKPAITRSAIKEFVMGLLSREQIFAFDDLKTKDVEVPEWGGEVRIRMLTGAERDEFETSMVRMRNGKQETDLVNLRARLVAKCAINEDGSKMFQSKNDVAALGLKAAAAIARIYDAAQELSGMTQSDVDQVVEDFDETPDENSTSD